MKQFYSNNLLVEESINKKVLLRIVSYPKKDGNLKEYVKKFINIRIFPYVNSLYGSLVESYYDELTDDEKIEILALLKKQINEIDDIVKEQIFKSSKKEISNKLGIKNNLLVNKKSVYSSVRGGQYGEMFLNNLFISLGYEKILSKLYIQWGPLSPTGIDAPYINIKNDILVLGESKLYKNIFSAIDSVIKDLNDIYNLDKIDKEVEEWNTKLSMMPEKIKKYIIDNGIENKQELLNKVNKIMIIGLVMGDCNSNLKSKMIDKINKLTDFQLKDKIEIALIVIPLESKDLFIKECSEVINDMIVEIGEENER